MEFRFGSFVLDTQRQELRCGSGRIALERRVFGFLTLLLERRGTVVGKHELLEALWPGIATGESSLTRVASLARAALGDADRTHPMIRTLYGRGYQFAAPVEATPADDGPGARATLTVLPFGNLSHDPELESVADGLVEDLITKLARHRRLAVIARNSSFVYKGKSVDVREVGRELGATYVMEGSVRRSGARARIAVQLVEAEAGQHLWAESYDCDLPEELSAQDHVVERVCGAIERQIGLECACEPRDAWRGDLFVGREAELAALERLLASGGSRLLVHVVGVGGIGKSELLRAFAKRRRERDVSVALLDCSQLDRTEEGLRDAFHQARAPSRGLIILDSFEYLAHLEHWLPDELAKTLPGIARVVTAGRRALAPEWQTNPAWQGRIETLALENLSRQDSLEYLERRKVPAELHGSIYETSFGHPLALSLVAEVLARTPSVRPSLDELPEVVQSLLRQLMRELPSQSQRLALWSAALVPVLHEDLLGVMLELPHPGRLFDWLTELSFVRTEASGLAVHDIARAAIAADLKWRGPQTRVQLAERALGYYVSQLEGHPSRAGEILLQLNFLMREFDDSIDESVHPDCYRAPLQAGDWPAVQAMLERQHGRRAAALARRWSRGPCEVFVARRHDGMAVGFALSLWLDRIRPEDAALDPGVAPLWTHFHRAGLLDKERVLYIRFVATDDDVLRPSPAMNVLYTELTASTFTLDHSLAVMCHLDYGEAATLDSPELHLRILAQARAHLTHHPEGDFELEGRRYVVLGRDFRDKSAAEHHREDCLRALHTP